MMMIGVGWQRRQVKSWMQLSLLGLEFGSGDGGHCCVCCHSPWTEEEAMALSLSRSQNGHRSPLCQHKQNKARHNGAGLALSSTQPAVAFHLHPFQKERSAAAARNRQHTDAQRLREPPQQATRVSTQHITLTHLVAYVGPGPAPTVSILQTWREKEKQVRRGGSTEGGGYWEWMRRRLGRGPLVE
jgi:hypothetical protein